MCPLNPQDDPFPEMAGVRTYPLASRASLVSVEDFCATPEPLPGFESFIDSLPEIYAGAQLKNSSPASWRPS